MADPTFGGPLQNAFTIVPAMPSMRHREQDTDLPSFHHYPTMSTFETSPYTAFPHQPRPQPSDPYAPQYGYPPHGRYQHFPLHGNHRQPTIHMPPPPGFSHTSSPVPPPAYGTYHNMGLHMPSGQHPDTAASLRDTSDMFTYVEPSFPGGMPNLAASHTPWHLTPPPIPNLHRRIITQLPGTPPPGPTRFSHDTPPSANEGRSPLRRTESETTNFARHGSSPNRRYPPQGPSQQNIQSGVIQERRTLSGLASGSSRSEQASPARPSNRRSFDRYSTDLAQAASVSGTNDAHRSPMPRVRRQRTVGGSAAFRSRMMVQHEPNVPTPGQMAELKDKLRHFLPHQLPSDSPTICDICQKEYSSVHVNPSEEEEVAIQLPCKHIFGEFCINTWVRDMTTSMARFGR